MPSAEEYTVGWICAIVTEHVAAKAFLSETHGRPEDVPPNDSNFYTLGRMGKHCVVIALLPDGEYGTSSAATVAKDMLRSFPKVRFGLMVGIGGGAPNQKHDIRLGDIVVSSPRDGKGGVLQYDFGKTIQEKSFHNTGFLDQPPQLLRTAVSGLRSDYMSDGHGIDESINKILEMKPRLQGEFSRPDRTSDRLFQSDFVHHANDGSSCAMARGDEASNLVPRRPRTKDEDDPVIHYGLIASANQLMKDALIRDRLAAEKDILCFEMEAAGLMNHFPCLVVRGICDYSDSHKNEEWQGYAAMAAAAYTKDLLDRIAPNKIEAEKSIKESLSSVHGVMSAIKDNLETSNFKSNRKEDLDILRWLTPIDYGSQQSDFLGRRQAGTGQWLLDSAEYKRWLEISPQVLFCPGIPGAGKTILASIVVDNLVTRFQENTNIGIAYIYCDFRRKDEQTIIDLLKCLLKQLAHNQSALPISVQDLYDRHTKNQTRPSFEDISRALYSVAAMYTRVFIIIDALDECRAEGSRSMLLSEIINLQRKCKVNIFGTSRFVPEVTEKFKKYTRLDIRAHDEDVRNYLEGRISRSSRKFLRDLPENIKTKIIKAVDGMFLLAQLYFDSIETKITLFEVEKALESFSTRSNRYKDVYRDIMERINGQVIDFKRLANQVLLWICCARRPLTTSELQHALAVEVGERILNEHKLPEIEDMVTVCAGLVTVDEESRIIRLVHYTAQEYFEQTQESWFPAADVEITKVCVTYLSFIRFENETLSEYRDLLHRYPLYVYAARNWGHHARVASGEVEHLVKTFFDSEFRVVNSCQVVLEPRYYLDRTPHRPVQVTGLHLAAYFGLMERMIALLKNQDGLEFQDSRNWTPLFYAILNGQEAMVKLLLKKGAKLNYMAGGLFSHTPLLLAIDRGNEGIVKLLLEKGADLEIKDAFNGQTARSYAVKYGNEAVMKLLLEKGLEVETKSLTDRTTLSYAAEKGYDKLTKLLLEKGAEIETRSRTGETPLSYAAMYGNEAVVRLLLEQGAELETKCKTGRTPLSYASEEGVEDGREAVVKLLLEQGAELETKCETGRTPLSYALDGGREAVVKLLLDKGAKPVSKFKSGETPLDWAKSRGHKRGVKLLDGGGDPRPGSTKRKCMWGQ